MENLRGYIGLGSNLGDRLDNLQRAVDMMTATAKLEVLAVSPVYLTPPWGYQSEYDYYNAVAAVEWQGPPLRLLEHCYRIEAALGRHREGASDFDGYRDRTIDLDILWLDGIETDTARLVLPHPNAHLRAFVLIPLAEIAPWLILRGRKPADWLAELDPAETGAVKRVSGIELVTG